MLRSTSHALKRPVVALLALALLVAMAAVSQSPPASAGDPASGGARLGPSKAYYNPVAPRLERIGDQQERLGKLDRGANRAKLTPSPKVVAQAEAFDRKHSGGNPPAAEVLGSLEARAAKTGKSPRAFKKAPAPRRPGC